MGAAMRYQPQGRALLNRGSALANGLLCAVVPPSRFDVALSSQYTQDGPYATEASPVGLGLSTNGSSSAIWLPIKSIALTKFTLFGVFRSNGNGVDARALSLGSSSNTVPIIQIGSALSDPGKVRLYARNNSNVTPAEGSSTAIAFDGAIHTVAIVYDGAQLACYIDGKLDSVSSYTNATITVDRFCVGALRRSTTAAWWAGLSYLAAAWKRDLTADEVFALNENPWQLFATEDTDIESVASERHTLAGADSSQTNTSSDGALTQRHQLAGAATTQANTSTVATVGTRHVLSGSASSQQNQSSSGVVSQRHVLAGAASAGQNESSAGAVSQRHVLAGSNSTQTNESSVGSLEKRHVLAGSATSQPNSADDGAIIQRHRILGTPTEQSNNATSGAIKCRHQLAGSSCTQLNLSASGALPISGVILAEERLYRLPAHRRMYVKPAEGRSFTVPAQKRDYPKPAEKRYWKAP